MRLPIVHAPGATFSYAGFYKLPSGTWTASATVAKSDRTVLTTLTCSITDPIAPETRHWIAIEASATQTQAWPNKEKIILRVTFTDNSGAVIKPRPIVIEVEA